MTHESFMTSCQQIETESYKKDCDGKIMLIDHKPPDISSD